MSQQYTPSQPQQQRESNADQSEASASEQTTSADDEINQERSQSMHYQNQQTAGQPAQQVTQQSPQANNQQPLQMATQQPAQQTVQQPSQQTEQQPIQQPGQQPPQQNAQQPTQQALQQPAQQTAQQPPVQTAQQSSQQRGQRATIGGPTGQLFPARSYLPENVRMASISLLNQCLADLSAVTLELKDAHWNVKGIEFYQLHELFEDLVETFEPHIDEVAERISALGGQALGTVHDVVQNTTIPQLPRAVDGQTILDDLSYQLSELDTALYQQIQTATQQNDLDTADLLNEVSRAVSKALWFVEAHLQGAPATQMQGSSQRGGSSQVQGQGSSNAQAQGQGVPRTQVQGQLIGQSPAGAPQQ